MTDPIEIARRLVELGVPVFSAVPCLGQVCGRISHRQKRPRFDLPIGWETTYQHRMDGIARWKPGSALCAVMGHTFDAVDYDVQNDREGHSAWIIDLLRPYAVAEQVTPSGGRHLLIRSLGLRKRTSFLPGVDFQGGTPEGGRGFVFIGPTVKPSKIDGGLRAYSWVWTNFDSDVQAPQWLRELVQKPSSDPQPRTQGGSARGSDTIERPDAYAARFWADVQRYADAPAGSGGNTKLWRLAVRVHELSNAGCFELADGLGRVDQARRARVNRLGDAIGGDQTDTCWPEVVRRARNKVADGVGIIGTRKPDLIDRMMARNLHV